MRPFREITPVRTCKRRYRDYGSYKKFLRQDFLKRCGYCNDLDYICGGVNGFHIDHFRPKVPFDHLKNDYSNLVYACPYCNNAKSNDWPSGDAGVSVMEDGRGYLDPCDEGFGDHFERYDHGLIRPKTAVGQYMFIKLKLGLRRHQLAWMLEQLEKKIDELHQEIRAGKLENEKIIFAFSQHIALTEEYFKHKRTFEETL